MKDVWQIDTNSMNSLTVGQHTFYLSSCESAAENETDDSIYSSPDHSTFSTSSNMDSIKSHSDSFFNTRKDFHRLNLRKQSRSTRRTISTSFHFVLNDSCRSSTEYFHKSTSTPRFYLSSREISSSKRFNSKVIENKNPNESILFNLNSFRPHVSQICLYIDRPCYWRFRNVFATVA